MHSPAKVLLVEGRDDVHVVRHLASRHCVCEPFQIVAKEGFDSLRASIHPELNAPGRLALGILADANSNPVSRYQSISQALTDARSSPPARLPATGALCAGPRRVNVGVWLMPDNANSGELEDFVAAMIPPADAVWPLSTAYIDGIPQAARKFPDHKITRAQVHAWLAAQERPQLMGAAIRDRSLDVNVPVATTFVAWLRALFG